MANIGDRVGAIVSANDKGVTMFGYGTYQGEEVPPLDIIGPFGTMVTKNPKIALDSGDVVWGCECWWGPEEKVRTSVGERPVTIILPSQYRGQRG